MCLVVKIGLGCKENKTFWGSAQVSCISWKALPKNMVDIRCRTGSTKITCIFGALHPSCSQVNFWTRCGQHYCSIIGQCRIISNGTCNISLMMVFAPSETTLVWFYYYCIRYDRKLPDFTLEPKKYAQEILF
jgi:hypothetical protein